MAKLDDKVKAFIVQRLAMFDTPTQVVEAVKEEYGLDLARQAVQFYDPTVGEQPGKKWVQLFKSTRDRFLEKVADIPIANKAVRLRRLERMAIAAENKRNYPLAAQLLEQAAKDAGDAFTNIHRLRHSNVPVNLDNLTDEQLEHIANGGSIEDLPG